MGGYLNTWQTFWVLWFYYLSVSVCGNTAVKTNDKTRLDMKHNSNVCWCYLLHVIYSKKIYEQIFDRNSLSPKSNKIAKGIRTV